MQWPRFELYVNTTVEQAPENVAYKVFFIGRHGEGFHNVAEASYGTVEWEVRIPNIESSELREEIRFLSAGCTNVSLQSYWAKKDNFTDPHLTDNGYLQAQDASAFWQSAMKYQHVPTPQSYYVSPLARCLSTAMLTYSSLELPQWRAFHCIVKEVQSSRLAIPFNQTAAKSHLAPNPLPS